MEDELTLKMSSVGWLDFPITTNEAFGVLELIPKATLEDVKNSSAPPKADLQRRNPPRPQPDEILLGHPVSTFKRMLLPQVKPRRFSSKLTTVWKDRLHDKVFPDQAVARYLQRRVKEPVPQSWRKTVSR